MKSPQRESLCRDLHEEQGVETSVCKPTEVVDITQGRVEGCMKKKTLSEPVDKITTQLQKKKERDYL